MPAKAMLMTEKWNLLKTKPMFPRTPKYIIKETDLLNVSSILSLRFSRGLAVASYQADVPCGKTALEKGLIF
jgi:hypothetical protein